MQWDHLCTFEAVARRGSLTAAARELRVSQSTVSRQLSRLEELAGSPLFLRETPLRLTDKGQALLVEVQPMRGAARAAQLALEDKHKLSGEVRLTTVGEILRWVLAAELATFYRDYPQLRLQILADNRVSSLAAGEADLALRLARPRSGELIGQRLHCESYGFFAAPGLKLGPQVPWLGLAGSLAQIPEQRFAEKAFAARPPRLLVEDVETLAIAVAQGLGVAILPRGVAAKLPELREITPTQAGALDLGPIPTRDFWLVVHRKQQRLPKVRAVMTWLRGLRAFDSLGSPLARR